LLSGCLIVVFPEFVLLLRGCLNVVFFDAQAGMISAS